VLGGLSGPAIRPIAVRMVWECRQAVRLPIIGMGGIATVQDALEFIIAGASAVQVGTANFADPFLWPRLIEGLAEYFRRHEIRRVADLVGQMELAPPEPAWIAS
jgi:dihydroorotate dehydrogenase (NAD+) catalytic subunit